jgi:polysaccharide biosynthesis/export protein
MVVNHLNRCGTWFSCWATVTLLLVLALCSGCNRAVYRVSNLPADCLAPLPTNSQTVNLAGLADATVSSDILQFGDVLEVTMVTDYAKLTTTTTPLRVADDGTIIVPLIGKVAVAGLKPEQAEQLIAAESIARGVFRNPYITLTMKQCRTNKITVVGAVEEPGAVTLPRASSSLLNALVAAGGLSKDADTEVEIRRTDSRNSIPTESQSMQATDKNGNNLLQANYQSEQSGPSSPVVKVNLNAVGQGIEKLPDLHDGDVVYVAKRVLKPVYVLGLVTKPGEIPYPANQQLRVLDAIAMAGGCNNPAAEDILVIRQPPGKAEPIRISVGLQAAKQGQDNLALAPGDIVSVEQTPATTAVEVIRTFFRIGMSVPFYSF